MRKIIHVDMDSFFASVEQRDFPQYRGKPLVVGGNSPRAVVAAASYEARKYGIHSAMPMARALQKCPHLIITPHRSSVYKEVSDHIQAIFHEYTDLVEPLSLDEAYLDVTEPKKGPPSASLIAKEIKNEIRKRENLVASAGVSYNKFLAKIASDMDKPDGFYLIKPEEAEAFLENLKIGLFFGVGKKTEAKMHQIGIFNGKDLKRLTLPELMRYFGKNGRYFYDVVRGVDERPVMPSRIRKSIGAERTYQTDIYDVSQVEARLSEVIDVMWERSLAKKKQGRTITLKLRYSDFVTITRSHSQNRPFTKAEIQSALVALLPHDAIRQKGVRLLGATMTNFYDEDRTLPRQLKIEF
ncbi:MAG: DNA polymerase IV [Salinivirgaceae bacterium]